MLAATEARNFTSTEGSAECRIRSVPEESYVSADTNRTARLVFPGPRMQLQTEIVTSYRRYILKDLFVVNLSYLEDRTVFAEHASLPIHGYGETSEEAIGSFFESFDFQWRSLVEVPEDSLTAGGQRRRAAMNDVVKNVVAL